MCLYGEGTERRNLGGQNLLRVGAFHARREELHQGVRFSLPGCPNALQWTVTTVLPPEPRHTVIHATINRANHERDFIDSIRQFVDDWKDGLEARW